MKRAVVWSDTARGELFGILRHVAAENPDAAQRIVARIEAAAGGLSDYATGRAGRVTGTYEKVLPGLPHILAYEIVGRPAGGEVVAVLHIIHGARDWPAEGWPGEES